MSDPLALLPMAMAAEGGRVNEHDAGQLGSVQMEYELEASSLLALRHAADAYRKTRPELG